MDGLPLEVTNYILSFIPHTELLTLRLVSKSFDWLIKRQFNTVNYIQDVHDSGLYDSRFISNLFNANHLAYLTIKKNHGPQFFDFIHKQCPQLQVLDIYYMYTNTKLSDLIRIGGNLKYFRLWHLEIDEEPVDADKIFASFPSLMAFDIHHNPVYPFCQKLWTKSTSRNIIQWSNKCKHDFNCHSASHMPNVNSVRSIELYKGSLTIDLKPFSASLEALTLEPQYELSSLYTLQMPNLKYLSINTFEPDLKADLILSNIFKSNKLRRLIIHIGSIASSSISSLLSLAHSMPELEVLDCFIGKVVKRNDRKKPQTFNHIFKTKLTKIELSLHKLDKGQFDLLKSLLKSSPRLTRLSVYTRNDQEIHATMTYSNNEKSLLLTTIGPSNMKQLLEIFASRFNLILDGYFSVKRGMDASFVETMVKFSQIKNLRGNFTEGFFKRWLVQAPRAEISAIKFNTYQSELHVMSNEAHDLLLANLSSGQLSEFQSNWLCPNRATCTCGLAREYRLL